MIQDVQDATARLAEAINDFINQTSIEHTETATPEEVEEQAVYPEYPGISSKTTIPEQSHDRIPANSETIIIDRSTSRFSSAVWYNKVREKIITLAGLGGIGRFGNLNYFSYFCTY